MQLRWSASRGETPRQYGALPVEACLWGFLLFSVPVDVIVGPTIPPQIDIVTNRPPLMNAQDIFGKSTKNSE